MPRHRAFPVVLAAPSGSGKTSLARALVERNDDVIFSLSATTRPPREGERNGEDYEFVDEAGFDALIDDDALLEWASVHGRRYGTLRRGMEEALAAGQTVVLDIDVQGARRVRRTLPDAVLVFVLPPSVAEMTRRLRQRASESAEEMTTRMQTARAELDAVADFDYIVVNDEFEEAMHRIDCIINAERGRVTRLQGLDERLMSLRAEIDAILERND